MKMVRKRRKKVCQLNFFALFFVLLSYFAKGSTAKLVVKSEQWQIRLLFQSQGGERNAEGRISFRFVECNEMRFLLSAKNFLPTSFSLEIFFNICR